MNGLTSLLVILVILLLIVAVAALVFGLMAHKKQQQQQPAANFSPQDPFHTGDADSLRGDPRRLKAGDIVEIRGVPYTVRGSIRLSEGGWTWDAHLLDDAKGTQLWLEVEEDPDLELSVWTPVEDAGQPGAGTITLNGRTYHLEESGTAHFRSEATTGLNGEGTVRYYDYEAPDGAMLGFESYGDAEWEASTGEQLSRYEVQIYPSA